MYTSDRNAQIVLSLLKVYGIRKIVISPGITNVPIALSVQQDSFFEVYSVVDERSAAYFATGLSFESGEPVAISCTGATASRNYLPALTEAYYRSIPVIALTSEPNFSDYSDMTPQVINRSVAPVDARRYYAHLPVIKDRADEKTTVFKVNNGFALANKGVGPIHINLLLGSVKFNAKSLPAVQKIDYYTADDMIDPVVTTELAGQLQDKKVIVYIGVHRKFSDAETAALERFIDTYDVVVFGTHTMKYRGKNRISTVLADGKSIGRTADIVIDIGGAIGDYVDGEMLYNSDFWRISEDGQWHQRFGRMGNLCKQFACSERMFFNVMANASSNASEHRYYKSLKTKVGKVRIPDLPFSNTYIQSILSAKVPGQSSWHCSTRGNIRNLNFFAIDDSISYSDNLGAFGIDGSMSTGVGISMAYPDKLTFVSMGDLAFFYDMNALGIRHIKPNLRVLLNNNGLGVEFRQNAKIEEVFHERIDNFVAAAGHNGSAKAWAESMNFLYFTASNREEFNAVVSEFCHPDVNHFDKPVFFECFTTIENEQSGLAAIRAANRNTKSSTYKYAVKLTQKLLPKKTVDALKDMRAKM